MLEVEPSTAVGNRKENFTFHTNPALESNWRSKHLILQLANIKFYRNKEILWSCDIKLLYINTLCTIGEPVMTFQIRRENRAWHKCVNSSQIIIERLLARHKLLCNIPLKFSILINNRPSIHDIDLNRCEEANSSWITFKDIHDIKLKKDLKPPCWDFFTEK